MVEEVLSYKFLENDDIVEVHIWKVPKSEKTPEGISYSLVYIRKGKRLLGYDNESHGKLISNHHKHIKEKIIPYEFIDEWKLLKDFAEDIEKMKREVIK